MPKNLLGFTLVELLIAIAIVSVLVVVLLPQLGQFTQSQSLSNAASDLEAALRNAQNSATSGVTCTGQNQSTDWFVEFSKDTSKTPNVWSYKLGNDCPPSSGATPTPYYTSSYYSWPSGTILYSIISNGSEIALGGSNFKYQVHFSNITGNVSFYTDDTNYSSFSTSPQIVIKLTSSGNYTCIAMEKGGSVYVTACP